MELLMRKQQLRLLKTFYLVSARFTKGILFIGIWSLKISSFTTLIDLPNKSTKILYKTLTLSRRSQILDYQQKLSMVCSLVKITLMIEWAPFYTWLPSRLRGRYTEREWISGLLASSCTSWWLANIPSSETKRMSGDTRIKSLTKISLPKSYYLPQLLGLSSSIFAQGSSVEDIMWHRL